MRSWFAATLVALALLIGCAVPSGAGAAPETTPPSAVATTPAKMRALVHTWSRLLNADDNRGIARLFSLPALFSQGPDTYRLRTYAQIAAWHAGLPCSGKIVSLSLGGRYVTAVFRLGNRGQSLCDAPGSLAAARFGIAHGKIVSWQQLPTPVHEGTDPPVA